MPGGHQFDAGMRPNIAGTAGHENRGHGMIGVSIKQRGKPSGFHWPRRTHDGFRGSRKWRVELARFDSGVAVDGLGQD